MSFPGQNKNMSGSGGGSGEGFKEILDKLSEAAKKKAETTAEVEQQQQNENQREDLNVLPLPDDQAIHDDCIIWTWECNGNDNFSVQAVLFTAGNKKGQYQVEMFHTCIRSNVVGFLFDEAKEVGQALISAWQYQNVWKDHAGDFMEKSWGKDGS